MSCLIAGAMMIAAHGGFTLSWTHSVEKIEWQESWQISDGSLHLKEARVRGSGAGMEPGENARLQDGWWVWNPDLTVPSVTLAASGATSGGWTLCGTDDCYELGAKPDAPISLYPCAALTP